jgi:hypothetical protein
MVLNLIYTVIVVCINAKAPYNYEKFTDRYDNSNWAFPESIPLDFMLDEDSTGQIVYYFCAGIVVAICMMFFFPVTLLLYVQIRNYGFGRTTNEVFATRSGPVSRTSTFLLKNDSSDEDTEISEAHKKLIEDIVPCDHNGHPTQCCLNCKDFMCKRPMPD